MGWKKNQTTNYNGKTTVFVLPSVTPMKEQEDYMFFMKQNKNKVFHQKTLNNWLPIFPLVVLNVCLIKSVIYSGT